MLGVGIVVLSRLTQSALGHLARTISSSSSCCLNWVCLSSKLIKLRFFVFAIKRCISKRRFTSAEALNLSIAFSCFSMAFKRRYALPEFGFSAFSSFRSILRSALPCIPASCCASFLASLLALLASLLALAFSAAVLKSSRDSRPSRL